jgi:hypothetical protein
MDGNLRDHFAGVHFSQPLTLGGQIGVDAVDERVCIVSGRYGGVQHFGETAWSIPLCTH